MKLNFIKTICTEPAQETNGEINPARLLDLLNVVTNAIQSLNQIGFSAQQIGSLLDAAADDKVDPTDRITKIISER